MGAGVGCHSDRGGQGRVPDLWSGGSASRSLAGSFVSGMTPRMVLLSDVPFSSRLRTSCMFRGESTLARMVEPGSSTASGVSSSGRRVGIWMALPEDAMVERLSRKARCVASRTGRATASGEGQTAQDARAARGRPLWPYLALRRLFKPGGTSVKKLRCSSNSLKKRGGIEQYRLLNELL